MLTPLQADTSFTESPAHIEGADNIFAQVEAEILPVQDLNGYGRVWTGGHGKNLSSFPTWQSGCVMKRDTGAVKTGVEGDAYFGRVTKLIPVTPGGTYTVSGTRLGYRSGGGGGQVTTLTPNVCLYTQDFNDLASAATYFHSSPGTLAISGRGSLTFTVPAGAAYMILSYNGQGSSQLMLEAGDTLTDYEPYSNICPITGWTECNITVSPKKAYTVSERVIYTVTFPSAFGTVYGGHVTVTRNASSNATIRRGMEGVTIDGSETFGAASSEGVFPVSASKFAMLAKSETGKDLCDSYQVVASSASSDMPDGTIARRSASGTTLYIRDTALAGKTASELAAWFTEHPVQYVGVRKEYQIVGTTVNRILLNAGDNWLWADCGYVSRVVYTPTAAGVWDAIRTGAPTHVQMIFSAQGVTLDDSDIAMDEGIQISDVFNGETDLTFGKAICKQLTARIIVTNRTRYMKWTDEFELRFGADVSGGTVWTTIGYFSGERPKNVTTADVVEFTAYDAMKKFDVRCGEFMASLTNPTTAADIYAALCTFIGVQYVAHPAGPALYWDEEIDDTSTWFTGGNVTCRDVLAKLAEAAGYYARINSAGKVELVWFDDHTGDFTLERGEQFEADYSDLINGTTWSTFEESTWSEAENSTWNAVCGDFAFNYLPDSVVVKRGSDQDEYPVGVETDNSYVINDNPFARSYDGQSGVLIVAQQLYEKLTTFGSTLPLSVVCTGNWMIEGGDIIYVQLPDIVVPLRIYNRTLRWNGAVEDTYEATGRLARKVKEG